MRLQAPCGSQSGSRFWNNSNKIKKYSGKKRRGALHWSLPLGWGRARRENSVSQPATSPGPSAPGVRPCCCDFPKSSPGRARRPSPSLVPSLPLRPLAPGRLCPLVAPPLPGEGDESLFRLAAGAGGRPAGRGAGAELELGWRAGVLPAAGRARCRLPLHARTSRSKRTTKKVYSQAPAWFGAAAGELRSPGLILNHSHENSSSSFSELLSKQQHP
ncbi:uncharacterized protein LOC133221943 [Neopsephotus bourkii]|uniref:uncharacterized protein LOC133221943 n=1 Tax=Neopsephotus bourkii TaxID=309878 RepID=UPI002AA5D8CB|nr:uncharacterized protein LOC133221943 [Neopsephotus bourkii]